MFFWNSLSFLMIQWMLAIWSLVLLIFLNPAWTSGISRFKYCWRLACRIWASSEMSSSLVKAMVFPVVMYGCESCTIKKAEHRRIDAFELWCWRRLSRVPWTARRSNHSILKEISPEYTLQGVMLKLKLQYFGQLMWRTDPLEETLMLGKIEGRRKRGWQRMI